ncbi:DUF4760 domain-containing protein [Paenibacillus xylanexedens]|uniref:DUF4760 domain-containing protein n=1 Tax=Paenibacillus xylanexedens TaxID=528191 RepID=UPI0011A147FF|nr:hypothetical protein [Paenibacillus xylanexedens]
MWFEVPFIEGLSFVIEKIYYIASIGLFASVIIGLRQLQIVKEDNKIRNQRASIEKSLEYLEWFAKDFIPYHSEFRQTLKTKITERLDDENEEIEVKKSIIEQYRIIHGVKDIEQNDNFDVSLPSLELINRIFVRAQSGNVLNQLEYFAAAMTSGLADEELAYNPLASLYCELVEEMYHNIIFLRGESNRMYSNIIKLYKIWKPRLKKDDIRHYQDKLSKESEMLPDVKIKSIGL